MILVVFVDTCGTGKRNRAGGGGRSYCERGEFPFDLRLQHYGTCFLCMLTEGQGIEVITEIDILKNSKKP